MRDKITALLNDLYDKRDDLREEIITEKGISVSRSYKQGKKDGYSYVIEALDAIIEGSDR